jgi:surface protein
MGRLISAISRLVWLLAGPKGLVFLTLSLSALATPSFALVGCSGEPGDVGKAGETYTLGDGTIVGCEGLLIVSEGMLRSVIIYGGIGDYSFNAGGAYDGVALSSGSYTMSQIYTGNITDMSNIFRGSGVHAVSMQDISKWDTSNVTNMSHMFDFATSFNGNIGQWDTSKVTDFSYMFKYASALKADIGAWNTSRATNMTAISPLNKYVFERNRTFKR